MGRSALKEKKIAPQGASKELGEKVVSHCNNGKKKKQGDVPIHLKQSHNPFLPGNP